MIKTQKGVDRKIVAYYVSDVENALHYGEASNRVVLAGSSGSDFAGTNMIEKARHPTFCSEERNNGIFQRFSLQKHS